MTRTIDTIEDINIDWLNSALEGIDEFEEDPIKDLKVNEMGEGIGQLGQFALLNQEKKRNFLQKHKHQMKTWTI